MNITNYSLKDVTQVVALFRDIFKENGWTEYPSDCMDEPHILFHLPTK
jgi:hypothetical protein